MRPWLHPELFYFKSEWFIVARNVDTGVFSWPGANASVHGSWRHVTRLLLSWHLSCPVSLLHTWLATSQQWEASYESLRFQRSYCLTQSDVWSTPVSWRNTLFFWHFLLGKCCCIMEQVKPGEEQGLLQDKALSPHGHWSFFARFYCWGF